MSVNVIVNLISRMGNRIFIRCANEAFKNVFCVINMSRGVSDGSSVSFQQWSSSRVWEVLGRVSIRSRSCKILVFQWWTVRKVRYLFEFGPLLIFVISQRNCVGVVHFYCFGKQTSPLINTCWLKAVYIVGGVLDCSFIDFDFGVELMMDSGRTASIPVAHFRKEQLSGGRAVWRYRGNVSSILQWAVLRKAVLLTEGCWPLEGPVICAMSYSFEYLAVWRV